jgi:catechol 1,2-dioxygenase
VSMLVETINDHKAAAATDSTVLGPFHMTQSPSVNSGRTSIWSAAASRV